jgi:hypothetical protein
MSRTIECRLHLLGKLENVAPYALPEDSLLASLNVHVRPPCGQAEFDEHLVYLKGKGLITEMEGALGDEKPRWLITEAGMAELRRA